MITTTFPSTWSNIRSDDNIIFMCFLCYSLGANDIGDTGVESLAVHGLQHCPKITRLGWVYFYILCNYCDACCGCRWSLLLSHQLGIIFVLMMIIIIMCVLCYSLRDNNIGASGVESLAVHGLQHCPNITSLEWVFLYLMQTLWCMLWI